MAGLSERAKLFLKISNSFTEHDATRLRETLVAEYPDHFGRAMAAGKSPQEIFNMLEDDNKLEVLVEVLRKLGKAKFVPEVENLAKLGRAKESSVAIHSTVHSKTTAGILVVVVVLCGICLQGFIMSDQQTDHTLLDRMTKMTDRMTKMTEEIEQLQSKIKKCIKRCESGVIHLPDGSLGKNSLAVPERTMERKTMFNTAFDTKPVVTIGLMKMDHLGDVRVKVDIVSILTTGLTVRFTSWNKDSELYSASVYWMACA